MIDPNGFALMIWVLGILLTLFVVGGIVELLTMIAKKILKSQSTTTKVKVDYK